MHELGLCEGVLQVGLDATRGGPIRRICVRVGERLGVSRDSWMQAWEMVVQDTPADGARMEMTAEAPGRRCRSCGDWQNADRSTCRSCQTTDLELAGGDGLMVEEVESVDGKVFRNPALLGQENP